MSSAKILVVGSVNGQLEKAFQKISKIQAKQNFSFAIIVGDLFSSDVSEQNEDELKALLDASLKVPLPTYFSVGDHALPNLVQEKLESAGEVCTNLFYLGRKGHLKTSEGIRIVNLGGRLLENEGSLTGVLGKYDPFYLRSEAKSLHGAHSAHIVVTNQWPTDITKNSQIPVPESIDPSTGTQVVSDLCLTLRPRYHFSSSPLAAWTREPFMHPSLEGRTVVSYDDLDGSAQAVTRFESRASINASSKEWMSAFTLDPEKPVTTEGAQPACPLSSSVSGSKRKRDNHENPNSISNGYSRYENTDRAPHHRGKGKRHKPDHSSQHCFMCMSNPTFDVSMVVSIGEESLLTVLKGPLPLRSQNFPQLQSSGHIMIIPMYHAADEVAFGQRNQDDLEKEFQEMNKYRNALTQMMATKGLGSVCWEVNRTGIRHLHWQLIACPISTLKNGLVEAAYKVAAEKAEYPAFQSCDPDQLLPKQKSDFFRLWLWTPDDNEKPPITPAEKAEAIANGEDDADGTKAEVKGTQKSMYFPLPGNLRFNIAFGREVMAGLLQLEKRSDWRDVESGNGLEEADATAFKEDFGPWDWAMQ